MLLRIGVDGGRACGGLIPPPEFLKRLVADEQIKLFYISYLCYYKLFKYDYINTSNYQYYSV